MRILAPVVLCSSLLIVASKATAQEVEPSPTVEEDVTDELSNEPSEEDEDLKAIKEKLEELEARDKARELEIAGLKEEQADLKEELAMSAVEGAMGDVDTTDPLRIFGFFDLTFAKGFYNKGNPYGMYIGDSSSFMLSNFNIFLQSNMTETLSALGELHFSFRPLGNETDWEIYGIPGTEYDRVDTETLDPNTAGWYRQGGVEIARIHLTYSPVDWFNILAGRYLTPYGIWNIDHGSPVVIPVRWPWMQIREMVPVSQTGLQAFGRFFPGDSFFFDYAITVSNGRGPIESVFDYDENKGLGLKLKLTYSGRNAQVALGGYGYYGKYTDIKKVVHINGISEYEGLSETTPLLLEYVETVAYDEYIAAADFLLEAFGIRLQSELVYKYVDYDNPPLMEPDDILFAGGTGTEAWFNANYYGLAVYGLLAYELPLGDLLGPLRVTPYFMFEDCIAEDSIPMLNFKLFVAGLNLKPSPYVVLKMEWSLGVPESEKFGSNINIVSAQMAVSF